MNAQRRLHNLITYGQTSTTMQDGGSVPLVQATFNDLQVLDGLGIVQHFGFSSSPPINTNVVAAFGSGDKSKGLILGTLHPASRRKMLVTGETVVHDVWGNEVHLSQAGITITHAKTVTITAPTVTINGALMVTGEVIAKTGGAQVLLSQHVHGNSPAPTPGT